jgi:hypothetical protein
MTDTTNPITITTKKCLNPGCNIEHSRRGKYCSDSCRNKHFHILHPGRRSLGNAGTPVNSTHHLPAIPTEKLNNVANKLDATSAVIFDILREQNRELRQQVEKITEKFERELKEKSEKIDALRKEKADAEKARDDAQRALDAKPTGLGALTSQPETLKQLVLEGLPMLGEVIKNIKGLAAEGAEVPPFVAWLRKQPQEAQQSFMQLMAIFVQAPEQFPAMLETAKRSLMSASAPEQKQHLNGSRYA